ncbi:MAG TPA: TatD family hydrolase [Candidatus Fimivicinus intestinavium]|nr:TatD family hydrolase [Candidatus Fimivicinus intestinavium]
MNPIIFDSHAHYDDKAFDGDREAVLAALPEDGVCGVINCGVDIRSSKRAIALAARYPYIWAAVGIHGQEAGRAKPDDLNRLLPLLEEPRAVALGEIGLDYHYDDGTPRKVQRELLERQLQIAVERDIPVILHDREAHEDMWKLLQKYRPRGVMHCFSGSVEMARDLVGLGMYIGLGGAVTFKNARRPVEVAAWVPEDRLLIETDAPYMTPVPFRGKRNTSALIPYTAEKIAQVRGITSEQVLRRTRENALRLFGLPDLA